MGFTGFKANENHIRRKHNERIIIKKQTPLKKVEFLFWIRVEYVNQQTAEKYRKLKILFCVKMLVTERRGKAQKIAHLKLKFNPYKNIITSKNIDI